MKGPAMFPDVSVTKTEKTRDPEGRFNPVHLPSHNAVLKKSEAPRTSQLLLTGSEMVHAIVALLCVLVGVSVSVTFGLIVSTSVIQ